MKKSLTILAVLAVGLCAAVAHAAGATMPAELLQAAASHLANPDIAAGLMGAGAMGITTFVQTGDNLDLDPGATVASGTGRLFGAALFGVAEVAAVSGTASSFRVRGVVTIAKTSALAIAVGDRLFWDSANSVVNKTSAAQQQVGIAVEAAANPSPTVKMLLMPALPVAT